MSTRNKNILTVFGIGFFILLLSGIIVLKTISNYLNCHRDRPSTNVGTSSSSTQNLQSSSAHTLVIGEPEETNVVREFIMALWEVNESKANSYLLLSDPGLGDPYIRNIRRILEQPGTQKPSKFTLPTTDQDPGRLAQVSAFISHGVKLHAILVNKRDGKEFDLDQEDNNGIPFYYQIRTNPHAIVCLELDAVKSEFLDKEGIVKIRKNPYQTDIGIFMSMGGGQEKPLVTFTGIAAGLNAEGYLKNFGLKLGDRIRIKGRQVEKEKRIACNLIKTSDGWKIKEIIFLPNTPEDREILESQQ